MAQFDKDGHLIVKGKQYLVGDLVSKLIFMQGDQLVSYLQGIGLNIPRKLRMGVLKKVLRKSVEKTIEERKSLADEMGYRLTWFSRYTDSQLVNLLEWYKDPSLSKKYLEDYWVVLLGHFVEKGVSEDDLVNLFDDAKKLQTKTLPQTKLFNQQLEDVLYDDAGEIDGVTLSAFRPVTYKASTLTELRAIGDKFDAPIPKRLKKQEVLDIILVKLRERGTLTRELEDKLSGQNILLLERYAKDNDIKVSTELKKEEIIEYILSNAKETKAVYFVPSSSAVYEKQVEEVEESFKSHEEIEDEEMIVEEEKVEETKDEKIEEIKEEIMEEAPVKDETKVKEVVREKVDSIDYRPQFDRLSKAFESLAVAFEKKEFVVNVNPVVSVDMSEIPQAKAVDHSKMIKQLLMEDEDMTSTQDLVVTPATVAVEKVIAQEIVNKEVVKVDKNESVIADPLAPVKVGSKFMFPKGLGKIAGFFAILSGLAWLAFAVFILPIPGFTSINLINDNFPYYDLTSINVWYLIGGGAVLAVFNFILAARILKVKISRFSSMFFGLISLATGFVLTGLFMLIGSFSKSKPIYQASQADGVGRIVEAINNLGVTMGKGTKQKSGKKVGKTIFNIILIILSIVVVALIALFLIWRLDVTYGYQNIDIFGFKFGEFLQKNIFEPLFGKAHYLTDLQA